MSVVVSAKVPKELKERAKRHGITISDLVRRALEAEVTRAEEEELRNELDRTRDLLKMRLKSDAVVRAIRKTREKR